MSADLFLTIKAPSKGSYKEKGSKFLAFAYPVISETDIKERLAELKKEYYDARHHCYAWMLGADQNRYRAYDDGEPNHSAGDPILGQIRSRKITNVLVVVVRYFGGIKLGVGGLVSAYKAAAEDALAQAEIVEVEVTEELTITYSYEDTTEIMRLVTEFRANILHQDFGTHCTMVVSIRLHDKANFEERFKLLQRICVDAAIIQKQ